MDNGQDPIVERIGQLADRAEQQEQEIKALRQQQNHLADELGKLIEAVVKISRSPPLREQAQRAQKVLTANIQGLSK